MPVEKLRDNHGRFSGTTGTSDWKRFVNEHEVVERWLRGKAEMTVKLFAPCLYDFCRHEGFSPEDFVKLDRREARRRVWDYVSQWQQSLPNRAIRFQKALASFYRSGTGGDRLTFDSGRGGAHHIRQRKVKNHEHIPSKTEVYQIVDACRHIRERAIILTLFQSGIRVNALCSLNLGHVRHCTQTMVKPPCMLRITSDIDKKLRGYSLDYYVTGLNKRALDVLRSYCIQYRRDGRDADPLFVSRSGSRMSPQLVWHNIKNTIERAGFDRSSMWVHSFRKAFKKQVNKADISDDFREAIMGHILPGSRENYFDRYDMEDIEAAYMQIPLEPLEPSEIEKATVERIEQQKTKIESLEEEIAQIRGFFSEVRQGNIMIMYRPKSEEERTRLMLQTFEAMGEDVNEETIRGALKILQKRKKKRREG